MSVSKRLRYEIFRRDNHTCRYCGGVAPDVVLTVDHVLPTTLGGSDEPCNLVAACSDCNAGKSASNPDQPLVDQVSEDAIRWANAMKHATETRTAELSTERDTIDWFEAMWAAWTTNGRRVPKGTGWQESVTRFDVQGLDRRFVESSVRLSMERNAVPTKDKWRYFCGICWRELDKRRSIALETIAATGHEALGDCPVGLSNYSSWCEAILHQVLDACGVNLEVANLADDAYWAGLQEAHLSYTEAIRRGIDPQHAEEIADEKLSIELAWFMCQLSAIHHTGLTQPVEAGTK